MDYNYENLGPERFQVFCQALLNSENTKIQSFPIGQPDGGRDALKLVNQFKTSFIVYQVKFVRKDEKEIISWLEETLKKESDKIKKLKLRGATEYILITNLSGTAHLDVGSIDKVTKLFEKYCSIPAMCWWRDDLNRKLDDKWNLKWTFPELLSTVDILRIIIESRINSEDKERRFNAISAYLIDQYETDSKVKFKQVEIQNSLLDLFIDVPIKIKNGNVKDNYKQSRFHHLSYNNPDIKHFKELGYKNFDDEYVNLKEEGSYLGASTFFLNNYFEDGQSNIVLEGGPGQGKSTITQYICQVNRIKLLNKSNDLSKIPDHHKKTTLRLPIKIDLRDFALWVKNKNPFSSNQNEDVPVGKNQSLESFIAEHIKYFSGGIEFNINDLHEITKISKILLVLDGFDEVADIQTRKEIVEIINKGIKRLASNSINLQVIVTSRPAAFINSPGFSQDDFLHLYLDSVNKPLIDIYADKWIKSKQLSKKEGAEITKILNEKIEQPHIKDLAKNPMQLAILISLIYTKGYSLPDKRTAFYDAYIEIFFNRESEKDETIRKSRELIIELHQYIAWFIHIETEFGSNGRITQNKLVRLVEGYLETEGHDINIAGKLFDKMAERVVALVSRIEGTYEFEVQPLREYFCAKYLYTTSNYSPVGRERTGTLPDRFDAMAKNFYWLNVLRFYCGCYSKGELPSIIERIEDLNQDEKYKYISQPRELSAILLSDWVFAQYPKLMQKVVKILLTGLGLRTLLTSDTGYNYRSQEMSLPLNSGRDEIIDECFEILKTFPPKDYALELIGLIRSNDNGQIVEKWIDLKLNRKGLELIKCIEYGLYLRIIYKLRDSDLLSLFEDKEFIKEKVQFLIQGGKSEFVESIPEISFSVLEKVLNGESIEIRSVKRSVFLVSFINVFQTSLFINIVRNNSENYSCIRLFNRYNFPEDDAYIENDFINTIFIKSNDSKQYMDYYKIIYSHLEKSVIDWNKNITIWEDLIESGRKYFKERLIFSIIANISAGIKSQDVKSQDVDDLFDTKKSLVSRVRYARLKSTNTKWWKFQFSLIKSNEDRFLCLLVLFTWSSTTVIKNLLSEIELNLSNLPNNIFQTLYFQLEKVCPFNKQNYNYNYLFDSNLKFTELGTKIILLYSTKINIKNQLRLKNDFLNKYEGNDTLILNFLQRVALRSMFNDENLYESLEIIKQSYEKGVLNEQNIFEYLNFGHNNINNLDIDSAKKILQNPQSYPRGLVKLSETVFKREISISIESLKVISERDKWFEN